MWRPALAAILFAATIFCGIWTQSRTVEISHSLSQSVPLSISESTKSQLNSCYEGFKKSRNLLSTLFVHEAVDEIADSFERSFVLLGLGENTSYSEESSHLKELLYRLPQRNDPSIENIF